MLFVIVIVVGKTSLLMRYVNDEFRPIMRTTVGIDFRVKTIQQNGLKLKLQVSIFDSNYAILTLLAIDMGYRRS